MGEEATEGEVGLVFVPAALKDNQNIPKVDSRLSGWLKILEHVCNPCLQSSVANDSFWLRNSRGKTMSDATLTLWLGFAVALLLLSLAALLVMFGCKAFFRGTGIQQLKNHKFEIMNADFKLNVAVSSVGGIMLATGCVFGFLGFMSAPRYEANLLTGVQKVTSLELAIPRSGMVAITTAGQTLTFDRVTETVSLSEDWGSYDQGSLTKALDADVGKGVVAKYAGYLKTTPDAVIVVDYGGNSKTSSPKDTQLTGAWSNAFRALGVASDQLVVVPGTGRQATPTISVATYK